MSSNPSDLGRPTPDDLGGIPVLADCPEDTTIRPRRAFIKVPPTLRGQPAAPTTEGLAGIPVCFGDDRLHPGQSETESDGSSAG